MAERNSGRIFGQLAAAIRGLANPVNLFSGAKLADALVADNIVVFKRTSTKMLKPQGVTHNYHHRFELVIPLARAGRIHVDDTAYLLSPGQVHLIFPHQFHHFLDIDDGEMNWLFITFECADARPLLPLRNSPRVFRAAEGATLLAIVNEYRRTAPGAERSCALVFQVSQLLRRLLAARAADCAIRGETADQDTRGAILQSINAYVRSNLDRSLTIPDVARHTGYSVSHLRAVFRGEFGVSLGSYMRESRLSVAAAMLSDPDRDSIEAIAKACGFVSIFAFSRAFKKAMGRSPRAYYQFLQEGGTPAGAPASGGMNASGRIAHFRPNKRHDC